MIVSGPGGKRKPVDLVDPCAIVVIFIFAFPP